MPLPQLDDDVLDIIWTYVRSDLRPRMNRNNIMFQEIRLISTVKICNLYSEWIKLFYQEENTISVIASCLKFYGLDNISVEMSDIGPIFEERLGCKIWDTFEAIPHLDANTLEFLYSVMNLKTFFC